MGFFSPLSLTQALPFLPLAQGDIDYESERRADPALISSLLQKPQTKVILTRGGKVAVPHGQSNIGFANVNMRLATLPGEYVLESLRVNSEAVAMFLGSYGGGRDEHVIAVDITRVEDANIATCMVSDSADEGADDAFDDSMGLTMRPRRSKLSLLQSAIQRFDWADLRVFAPHASSRETGQATTAVCLSIWHTRQRCCPTCGAPVETSMSGWAQRCTSTADGNRLLFPRIEPAVITVIVDSEDRILLQHNSAWNDSNLYSVSAGFVEAGENLEHAARREAKEEVGITLGEMKYLGSQPWPFPASLMVAFKARALDTDIRVDGSETLNARWATRDEYMAELTSGRMQAPGKATIARYMIEEWVGHELP